MDSLERKFLERQKEDEAKGDEIGRLKGEYLSSLDSKDKAGVAMDLLPANTNLLEVRRRGLFRNELFKEFGYEPHSGQKKFHDARPTIEREILKLAEKPVEGEIPEKNYCRHEKQKTALDPKNVERVIVNCFDCGEVWENVYYNRYAFACCAARYGKSMMVGYDVVDMLMWPGINPDGTLNKLKAPLINIYAPKYEIGEYEFNFTMTAMEELGLTPKKYHNSANSGNLFAEYEWGPRIQVKSWDNARGLLGDEPDIGVICEGAGLPKSTFFRYIRSRLGTRQAYVRAGSTPHGFGELLEEMYHRGIDPKQREFYSQEGPLSDNPYHPKEDIEEARRTMPVREFSEQYLGKFVSMTGLVYEDYDSDIHVKDQIRDPADLPPGCQVVASIDFGIAQPFCCLIGYWDQDGKLHIVWEHYQKGWKISKHWNEELKKAFLKWLPEWLVYDYGDPAAAQQIYDFIFDMQHKPDEDGKSFPVDVLKMVPCNKKKQKGLVKVRELLHVDPETDYSLFEMDFSCINTQVEFPKYQFKTDKDGKVMEDPKPGNDHAMDCIEYMVNITYEEAEERGDRIGTLKKSDPEHIKEFKRAENIATGEDEDDDDLIPEEDDLDYGYDEDDDDIFCEFEDD